MSEFDSYSGAPRGRRQLYISLDLGGDTLKIAFAFKGEGEQVEYGKFVNKSRLTQIALPALACYDTDAHKWIFADEVDRHGGESFLNVVKIKGLISMLRRLHDEQMWEQNKAHYYYGNNFPKFYFPVRRRALENYQQMVNEGRTFHDAKSTPQSVCEAFFRYVRSLVDTRVMELSQKTGYIFSACKLVLVHPARVGDEYLTELSALIKKAFGTLPYKTLTTTQSLAHYAHLRGLVDEGEHFLVFDMGEENISVVHASYEHGQVVTDGAEGHNDPGEIGGNDVDEAIVYYLENMISDRETIGTPSAGNSGHISEYSVYEKQYLLMKDVKKAKVFLSKPDEGETERTVPVTFSRDVLIQRRLTHEDMRRSVGVADSSGVADSLLQYIVSEAAKPINRKVRKIFVSGGLTETYSLLDYIKASVKDMGLPMEILTFEDRRTQGDVFDIMSYEDAVFAPAVGGAFVALNGIDIKDVLSLSFGTWGSVGGVKCLVLFATRGEITEEGKEFTTSEILRLTKDGVSGEEIFSAVVTDDEITENHRARGGWDCIPATRRDGSTRVYLVVGEPESAERAAAERAVDLKVVSGGQYAKITFWYGDYPITLPDGIVIQAVEGIRMDKDGRAQPFLRNVSASHVTTPVYIMTPDRSRVLNQQTVRLNEIQVVLEGAQTFDTPNS